jgi:predicted TIM-barrel fold metal-dependent hydrolase
MSDAEQKEFMFWYICQWNVKHELSFQVHTGDARIRGLTPLLLVNVTDGNPDTKFILFHGGYPWVGATAVKYQNLWMDSC